MNPGRAIPAEATAIHGITDAMVARAPSLKVALKYARGLCRGRIVAAHSARFDLSFVGPSVAAEALCTMRLARALFPEAPNHKNQTLRQFLDIDGRAGESFSRSSSAGRRAGKRRISSSLVAAALRLRAVGNPGRSSSKSTPWWCAAAKASGEETPPPERRKMARSPIGLFARRVAAQVEKRRASRDDPARRDFLAGLAASLALAGCAAPTGSMPLAVSAGRSISPPIARRHRRCGRRGNDVRLPAPPGRS